jgi:hypothetical protein
MAGRKPKDYGFDQVKKYSSNGKNFIKFDDINKVTENVASVPQNGDLITAPYVSFDNNGKLKVLAQLPLGYFV